MKGNAAEKPWWMLPEAASGCGVTEHVDHPQGNGAAADLMKQYSQCRH